MALPPEFFVKYFESAEFRKSYEKHRSFFLENYGFDIDLLFPDDYRAKVTFQAFYKNMESGQFFSARRSLESYEEKFCTEEQKRLYEKLKVLCLNKEAMNKIAAGDWVKESPHFIYRVMQEENGSFLIKRVFRVQENGDLEFRGNHAIRISDLACFTHISEEEREKINAYFSLHPEDTERLDRFDAKFCEYREKLLSYGMVNPHDNIDTKADCFYKYTSGETAFVINITDYGDRLFFGYGVCSISLDPDYRDFFGRNGCSNDDINIRRCFTLKSEGEEAELSAGITAFYSEYAGLSREAILAKSKEIRKEFMKLITDKLKPLGFKKSSNHWRKPLENGFYIEFSADKSAYSDSYQFDTCISREEVSLSGCYINVPEYNGECIAHGCYLNWQMTSREAFTRLLDDAVLPIIKHILSTPQEKWASDGELSSHALFCDRDKCEQCPFRK